MGDFRQAELSNLRCGYFHGPDVGSMMLERCMQIVDMEWSTRHVAKRADCALGGGDVGGEEKSADAV